MTLCLSGSTRISSFIRSARNLKLNNVAICIKNGDPPETIKSRIRKALFINVKEVDFIWIMHQGVAENLRIEQCTIESCRFEENVKIAKRLEIIGPIKVHRGDQIGIREWFEAYYDLSQLEEVLLEFKTKDSPDCIAQYLSRMPKLKSLDVTFETGCQLFNALQVASMRPIPKVRFRFRKLSLLTRNS